MTKETLALLALSEPLPTQLLGVLGQRVRRELSLDLPPWAWWTWAWEALSLTVVSCVRQSGLALLQSPKGLRVSPAVCLVSSAGASPAGRTGTRKPERRPS